MAKIQKCPHCPKITNKMHACAPIGFTAAKIRNKADKRKYVKCVVCNTTIRIDTTKQHQCPKINLKN